jgi:glycosyltransferase involved in cell wall biosynthesis
VSRTGGSTYAFVQHGSFSSVNDRLRAALDARLAPCTATKIDVKYYQRLGRGIVLNMPVGNVPAAVRELGTAGLRRPRGAINRRRTTTYMFDHYGEVARARARRADPAFVLQTQTVFNARLPDVPYAIYTDHTVMANRRYPDSESPIPYSAGWVRRETDAYRAADLLFTTTEFAKRSLVEDYGCDGTRIRVVNSGVNLELPSEALARTGEPTTILFLGREWERKGGPLLIRAFSALRERHPSLRLVIAGTRPRVSGPGIEVVGPVSIGQVDREADIFCLPSWREPSAVVYSEAGAYGLPVVATAVGGTPERVADGVTGYLCAPGDADALLNRLEALITAPEAAHAMGRAGRALVEEKFTWNQVAALMERDLRPLLGGH